MPSEDTLSKEERKEVQKEVQKEVEKEVKKQLSRRIFDKAKRPFILFHHEFRQQASTAIVAAFGFIIALAWKDVVTKFMADITSTRLLETYPYLSDVFSAAFITFFAVLGIIIVSGSSHSK